MKNFFSLLLLTVALNPLMAQQVSSPIVIKTANTVLVYKVDRNNLLRQAYFGSPFRNPVDYSTLPDGVEAFLTGGASYPREPALAVTHANGNRSLQLQFSSTSTEMPEPNIQVTHIRLTDPVYPFELTLHFKAYQKENIIEQSASIVHHEKKAITLERFASSCLHLHAPQYYLMQFFGDWANEMNVDENILPPAISSIDSKLGVRAANFHHPSFMLSLNQPATEKTGEVLAGTLAWNGNFNIIFENIRQSQDYDNLLQIMPGINAWSSAYKLEPGLVFETPAFVFTYSTNGKGQASRNFHQWANNYGVWKGNSDRKTLLNNWENTHFNFDQQKLVKLFDHAKELGVDVFLLDDGWFGNKYPRNDAKSGLGDWQYNTTKLPDGVRQLVQEAQKKGISFGIWVEPEMINPRSALYEKHKDWVLSFPDRPAQYQRDQLVLDLTNPAVQDHVFSVVDKLLADSIGVRYIKWDCNRYMGNAWSPYLKNNQDALYIDYARGLNKVLDRLRKKYPDAEMMLCSGGGNRSEYGSMKYFQEFWPSDNTTAFDRIFIQWGFSYFFPASTMCAHVTSRTKLPFKFRTDVAMMGKLGYDIDVSAFDSSEMLLSKSAVANYKRLQRVIGLGQLYRLVSPYDGPFAALLSVDSSKQKAVLFSFNLHPRYGDALPLLQLDGLDPDKKYRVDEINLVPGQKPAFRQSGQVFTGDYLMKVGVDWFLKGVTQSSVLEITEIRP